MTQYRYFQVFISHGLLIPSVLYMTTVEGFRPTWRSLLRVIIGTNLYIAILFPLNLAIGSNYMFLAYKPEEFASILDFLPAWPHYILYLEILGILVFLLLYLPFALKNRRATDGKFREI